MTRLGGERSYRWMDIRDFNIPYWIGNKEHVTMVFKSATEKDDPKTFDWRILYGSDKPIP